MSEPRHWCWSQSSRTGLLSSHCVRREILGGGWTSELILSTSHDRLCKHVIWFCVYLVIGKKWHHHQQRQRHETLTDFSCNETLWKKCMRTDSKSGNGEIDENTWQDVLMKWIEMCTVAALISRWGESARETLRIYLSYSVDLNFSDKDKNKMTLITVSIPLPCEVLPEMLQILTNRVLENP